MSADDKAASAWDDYINQKQEEKIEELERELNAANERIMLLEEAGIVAIHEAVHGREDDALEIWRKAKEAKL